MASLHLEPIDSSSKIPYYLQMKNALLEHIKKQILQPGDILPSEAQLGKQFNVSRTVVRQALMELEYEGLIYKRKGKGAFISEPKVKMGAAPENWLYARYRQPGQRSAHRTAFQ